MLDEVPRHVLEPPSDVFTERLLEFAASRAAPLLFRYLSQVNLAFDPVRSDCFAARFVALASWPSLFRFFDLLFQLRVFPSLGLWVEAPAPALHHRFGSSAARTSAGAVRGPPSRSACLLVPSEASIPSAPALSTCATPHPAPRPAGRTLPPSCPRLLEFGPNPESAPERWAPS